MSRRLSENRSTTPLLQTGELLVASAMPISTRVHQLHLVLDNDGQFESAERFVRSTSNSLYHKEIGRASEGRFNNICEALADLLEAHQEAHATIPFDQIDPFEYETPDRRGLSFWQGEARDGCSVWGPALYEHHSISRECYSTFRQQFDRVWMLLIPLIDEVHFDFTFGDSRSTSGFPLVSRQ